MTSCEHLLLVALGPAQDFIVQARRTRDLWQGSHMLAEICRAAARSLAETVRLVLPPLKAGHPELSPCPGLWRESSSDVPLRDFPLSVSNRLIAVVPASLDPASVARDARAAAQAYLRAEAATVYQKCRDILQEEIAAIWEEQVEDLLEFYAVWTPLVEGGWRDARRRVEQLLAGRKNLRDFQPWEAQCRHVDKSSLDGARETVLIRERDSTSAQKLLGALRIGPGEELDAIGLMKRAGGRPAQFLPLANVAMAGWICEAADAAGEDGRALATLRDLCEHSKLPAIWRPDLKWVKHFPFDAQILMPARWESLAREGALDLSEPEAEAWGKENVTPLLKRRPSPPAYLACLVADGDGLGEITSQLSSAEAQEHVAASLSDFSRRCRVIVEHDFRGSMVYAGGDDLLAFACLDDALHIAQRLREAFEEVMRASLAKVMPAWPTPTLSVGLGVGHLLDNMGELLALGRRAEALAKGRGMVLKGERGDALGILVDRRSGGLISWRGPWREDPVGRLREDQALLAGPLSTGKVYEVRRATTRFPSRVSREDAHRWANALRNDVTRIVGRIHGIHAEVEESRERLTPASVALATEDTALGYAQLRAQILAWTDRLLVARAFTPEGAREERS